MRTLIISNVVIAASLFVASAQTPPPQPPTQTPAPPMLQQVPGRQPPPAIAPPVSPDTVVLTIGDQTFTRAQFEAFIAAMPDQLKTAANGPQKRKFIEQYAEMKAMAFEARRRKLDQNADLKQMVALQTDNLLANELYKSINASVKVDDAALHKYYDDHKSEFEEVKASHILIRFKGSQVPVKKDGKDLTEDEALAKAKDIKAKLSAGGDFAALAKENSDDSGSAANGGSLGTFGHGRMVKAFEDAAFTMKPGEISDPVKSQFGYHIIKVESHTAKTFDEVKPQIEARLKPEIARKAMEDVKKTVPITIDDAYFGK
ncbi:MAG TPA: peptidylprolyl isomerase [Bryobacteraceae bacterium]|nr:peptidylprolyl isomerase [Bryobacteraceae bacterium]